MAFDGIVLSRVTELLNETIVTGRISKLYQISKYELLMTVRAQNENKKLLVSIHPMYREFDSCLHFFTNQIAQNVDYINAFEFFCCQICEIICSIM